MISVIIPVYNVEPYLRKCLDSVLNQTYRDLEILIIDDGSTDGSGKICDEYKVDERVKVFHTENRGLSAARNLGLDNATGDWIGFVDSDDWIEPDMNEVLIKRAEETGADVVECGFFIEYPNRRAEVNRQNQIMSGLEAVSNLLENKLYNAAWNKLWRRDCYKDIRFPEGRVYEDIATTYRVFYCAKRVCSIDIVLYHYVHRKASLTNTRNLKNLDGYWRSHKERYEYLYNRLDQDSDRILKQYCAEASARIWSNYFDCRTKERIAAEPLIQEVNLFTKDHFPLLGENGWDIRLRAGTFFSHFNNVVSFGVAWMLDNIYKAINQKGYKA
jgi:glycosyltransferase involved in cell wall biosynthesis